MEGFYSIQQVLEIIRNDLITIGADIVWIGQAIAAIGALLYIAKLSYEGMLGGNLFTLRTLRPFAIALVCSPDWCSSSKYLLSCRLASS